MIFCKELNKSFETNEDLFKELRDAKDQIIASKKAKIYKSYKKGLGVKAIPIDQSKLNGAVKALFSDKDYYYLAVNTTRILDSHNDLHIDGIWNKTKKDQQGKNYLVLDHKLEVQSTIVKKEHIEMFTTVIPFAMLRKGYKGETEALIYKFRKDKVLKPEVKEWLDSGDAIEASVRMQYVDILFAAKSEDEKEKAVYDEYYDIIANKEEFEDEILYFWPVKQAKNVAESSLVLYGSNSVTGLVEIEDDEEDEEDEPEKSTQEKIEPSESDTQESIYKFLLNNLKVD